MATTLRELIARVVFRTDPSKLKDLNTRIDAAKAKLKGLDAQAKKPVEASGLGGLTKILGGLTAAAAAYKAIGFGRTLIDEARAVGDLAARLSIGTDELQTWSAFVEEVGGSNEDLSGTVKTLAKNIATAAQTAKGPGAEGFKRLGISTAGWAKEMPNTMEVLLAAGGALGELSNDTERCALAQELLGEAGLKLLPAFEGGTEAAREQLAELRELAVVYDKEFIKSSTAATNEMRLFERQLKGVGVQVLLDVLPALRNFVHWLTPVVKGVRSVVRDSNLLTAAFGVLGVGGIGKLITKFGGLNNILKVGGRLLLKYILPLLLLDDVISFLKGDGSVIGDKLRDWFGAGADDRTREGILGIFEGFKVLVAFLKGDVSADEFFDKFIKGTQPVQDAIDRMVAYIKLKIDELVGYTSDSIQQAGLRLAAKAVGITQEGLQAKRAAAGANPETGMAPLAPDAAEQMPWYLKALGKVMGVSQESIRAGRIAGGIDPDTGGPLQNANNALALGGNPSMGTSSKSTTVTVNDNSSVTTTLNGVDGQNVGAALRQSERNVTEHLKRSKAQVVRQTVGAAGT